MAASTGNSRLLIWIAILFMQLLFILIAVPSDLVQKAVNQEESYLKQYFGESSANKIKRKALGYYTATFQNTGVIDESYAFFLPSDEALNNSKGIETLGVREGWWDTFRNRLESFWLMVYFMFLRLYTIMVWWPLMMVFIVAATYDGLVTRKIKLLGFESTAAPVYGLALHAFVFMMFVPFFYAFSPIAINPLVVPIWGILMGLLVKIKASNLQRF